MNKKAVIFIIINFFIIKNFYSTDFSKDNGKIILQKNENNIQTIIRKCELEVIVGDMLNPQRRVIYDGIYKKNVLGNLVDNDKIKILELCSVKYFAEPKKRNTYKGDLWYKISFNGGTGWICYYYNKYEHHPFEENEYKRSTIEIDGKLKKIRELNQVLSVFDNLDILDLPSIKNGKIVYTIKPGSSDPIQTNINIVAIEEDEDTIEGKKDYWLKIKYKEFEGWVFGAYCYAERGGPKYEIPEELIKYDFGWYK